MRPPTGPPLVFVDDVDLPSLDPDDAHHLTRVLRLRPGDLITAADGAGRWRAARIAPGGGLDPDGPVVEEPPPAATVTVALAPVKGERPEWAVQKLTELGVDRIVFLHAERSVVRWDGDRAGRHLERLARVCREAAMQSRRSRLPVLDGPRAVADVVAGGVALADPTGDPVTGHPALTGLAVGPEGGWTSAERALAPSVALAAGVLRTETAAVVAGALLCGRRDAGWPT